MAEFGGVVISGLILTIIAIILFCLIVKVGNWFVDLFSNFEIGLVIFCLILGTSLFTFTYYLGHILVLKG